MKIVIPGADRPVEPWVNLALAVVRRAVQDAMLSPDSCEAVDWLKDEGRLWLVALGMNEEQVEYTIRKFAEECDKAESA